VRLAHGPRGGAVGAGRAGGLAVERRIDELVRGLEEQLLRPDVRRSPTAVAELLADEFVEFGSSGRVLDKRQIIDVLRGETTRSPRSVLGSGRGPSRRGSGWRPTG